MALNFEVTEVALVRVQREGEPILTHQRKLSFKEISLVSTVLVNVEPNKLRQMTILVVVQDNPSWEIKPFCKRKWQLEERNMFIEEEEQPNA